jgi:hypothetical protein
MRSAMRIDARATRRTTQRSTSAAPGRTAPVVPEPTGRRVSWAGREWVVHTRVVAASPRDTWDALTVSERLEQWIGAWRRLADESVEFLLTFEGDDLLPAVYRVEAYVAGRSFTVRLCEPGALEPWEVRVEVAPMPPRDDRAVLTLTHSVTNLALAPHLASGCEYYLDRLVGLLARTGSEHVDYDEYFLAQASHYRRLFPLQRSGRAEP